MKFKIRVINPEHSKEIQKVLFALGYAWHLKSKQFCYLDETFLYTDSNMKILYSGNYMKVGVNYIKAEIEFEKHKYQEVTLEDLKQLLKDKTMSKKITEQEFNVLKELCEIKKIGICSHWTSEGLSIFPYISFLANRNIFSGSAVSDSPSISFNEALKILAEIKTNKIVKLSNDYDAKILKDRVVIEDLQSTEIEFTPEDIEKLYNAIK